MEMPECRAVGTQFIAPASLERPTAGRPYRCCEAENTMVAIFTSADYDYMIPFLLIS
jgi:hypothetical protein